MKKLLTLFLLVICLSAFGQDTLNISSPIRQNYLNINSFKFQEQIDNIQLNLSKYRKERQTGALMGFGAVATGVTAFVLYDKNYEVSQAFSAAALITGVASVIFYLDAEKYLKRASIKISPVGLKVNF